MPFRRHKHVSSLFSEKPEGDDDLLGNGFELTPTNSLLSTPAMHTNVPSTIVVVDVSDEEDEVGDIRHIGRGVS